MTLTKLHYNAYFICGNHKKIMQQCKMNFLLGITFYDTKVLSLHPN